MPVIQQSPWQSEDAFDRNTSYSKCLRLNRKKWNQDIEYHGPPKAEDLL